MSDQTTKYHPLLASNQVFEMDQTTAKFQAAKFQAAKFRNLFPDFQISSGIQPWDVFLGHLIHEERSIRTSPRMTDEKIETISNLMRHIRLHTDACKYSITISLLDTAEIRPSESLPPFSVDDPNYTDSGRFIRYTLEVKLKILDKYEKIFRNYVLRGSARAIAQSPPSLPALSTSPFNALNILVEAIDILEQSSGPIVIDLTADLTTYLTTDEIPSPGREWAARFYSFFPNLWFRSGLQKWKVFHEELEREEQSILSLVPTDKTLDMIPSLSAKIQLHIETCKYISGTTYLKTMEVRTSRNLPPLSIEDPNYEEAMKLVRFMFDVKLGFLYKYQKMVQNFIDKIHKAYQKILKEVAESENRF